MRTDFTNRLRSITWTDIESVKAAASASDYLQGWSEGRYPAPAMARLMGIELVEVERGRAVFAVAPHECHYNPMGTVHGGLLATLIDSATGIACMSLLPPGTRWTTANLNLSFFRRASEASGLLRCEGVVVHEGNKIIVADAAVRTADGELIASGRGTCAVL